MSATASTSSSTLDLEAQRPQRVATRTSQLAIMDPMDASFGYTLNTPSAESRHDERRQSLADVPPPYAEDAGIPLPEYTLHAPEPATLAMFLFKFGFLFPPFWIFGAFILLSPLREPSSTGGDDAAPAWMPEKTEEERQEIIATLRTVELKWARRCLCALAIFTLLAVGGGLAAWGLLRH